MKQRILGSYNKLKETNVLSNFFNLSSIQISNILLLLIIIRVITGIVGIAEFGVIMLASRFAQTAGMFINYGTHQSAIRDVAYNLTDTKKLSIVFYNTLWIRAIIFTLFIIVLAVLNWFNIPYYSYIVLTLPMVVAELFNPLCFFIGAEKIKIFNIYNLLSNIAAVLALLLFIKHPNDAIWVNFILGTINTLTYIGLLIYLGKHFNLQFYLPQKNNLLKMGKDNFYITINNVSVNLQQSVIIFALGAWGNESILGAYSLCDRVIGQCRNLINTISNAVYPNAAHLYKQSTALWNAYRKKTKYIITGIFFAGSIFIFVFADFIVFVLSKEHNATAILFLKIMAFVPTVSALNVLNVLDQLLKNNTVYIFRIATILLGISFLVSFGLLKVGNTMLIGSFTLIIEFCALLMYEYLIKKTAVQNG